MIEQGSIEWHLARAGKLTASRIADALAKTKSGWSASRANLMATLIVERITGQPQDSYTSPAMQFGIDTEPQARAAFEFQHDLDVTLAGFVDHPEIAMAGCSPDGFIADDGLIEIKCPNTATHLDTLLGASIDGRYLKQMQWQMACTGRAWCWFVSFDPRVPPEMQLHAQLVHRDDKVITELEREAIVFLDEVAAKVDLLRTRFNLKDQLVKSLAAE